MEYLRGDGSSQMKIASNEVKIIEQATQQIRLDLEHCRLVFNEKLRRVITGI